MIGTIHVEKKRLLRQLSKRTIKNFMDILVLSELRRAPMSGYDVISSIFERFNFLPSSGSVYSLLYILEREGFIEGEWNGRKRVYALTAKGEEVAESVLTLHTTIQNLLDNIFSDHFL